MMSAAGALAGLGVGLFAVIFYLAFLVLWIYVTVLVIKFLNRGIKALDIYLLKNSSANNNSKIE